MPQSGEDIVVESDLLHVAVAQLRWDGIVSTGGLDSSVSPAETGLDRTTGPDQKLAVDPPT